MNSRSSKPGKPSLSVNFTYIHPSVYLFILILIYLFVNLFNFIFINLSVYLVTFIFIILYVHLYIFMYISICLSINRYIYLCLLIYQSIFFVLTIVLDLSDHACTIFFALINRNICVSIYLNIYPGLQPCFYLSIYLSANPTPCYTD